MIFIRKIRNGQAPAHLSDRLKPNIERTGRELRNKNDVTISTCKKQTTTNSLFHKELNTYNQLTTEIKNEKSDQRFKIESIEFIIST